MSRDPGSGWGRARRVRRVAVLATVALVARAAAQSPRVRTVPSRPARGTVAWLLVHPPHPGDSALSLDGSAAGEPLHFERLNDGSFRGLIGIPLDGGDTLDVALRLSTGAATDSTTVPVVVTHRRFRNERLTVAPNYAEPDSAARARISDELAQSRALSRQAHDTPRLWTGRFHPPRPGRITSPYGSGREFNGAVTSRHLGTDYAGALGAPVRAPARGVVALVADFYLAGHAVYLDHGAGLVTGYFHLSRVTVASGDTVQAGEQIGAVGRSGRVTGPHLHWIARYGGITVDPASLLALSAPAR